VEEARSGAGECSELGPGSYRVRFALGRDGRVYTQTAILIVAVLTGASGLLVAATSWRPRPALRPAPVP